MSDPHAFLERIKFADERIKEAAAAWNAKFAAVGEGGSGAFVAAMGEFIADQLAETPGPDRTAEALLAKFMETLCDAYVEKRHAVNAKRGR